MRYFLKVKAIYRYFRKYVEKFIGFLNYFVDTTFPFLSHPRPMCVFAFSEETYVCITMKYYFYC